MAKRQGARNIQPQGAMDGAEAIAESLRQEDPALAKLLDLAIAETQTVDGVARHAMTALTGAAENIRHLHDLDEDGHLLAAGLVAAAAVATPGRPRPGLEEARALALLQEISRARDTMSTHVHLLSLAISGEYGTSAARLGEVAGVANSTVSRWIKTESAGS